MNFKFCPLCGNLIDTQIASLSKNQYCKICRKTFYKNPAPGVAVILIEYKKILLVRRTGTYSGRWCIPCGYLEYNEDVRCAAVREIKEETGLDIEITGIFDVLSNFHDLKNQTVGIWFLGKRIGGNLLAGSDADRAVFFPLDKLPDNMAFPSDLKVCKALKTKYLVPEQKP